MMDANAVEAFNFWCAASVIRLKRRAGSALVEYEDELTEIETIALCSKHALLRCKCVELLAEEQPADARETATDSTA